MFSYWTVTSNDEVYNNIILELYVKKMNKTISLLKGLVFYFTWPSKVSIISTNILSFVTKIKI